MYFIFATNLKNGVLKVENKENMVQPLCCGLVFFKTHFFSSTKWEGEQRICKILLNYFDWEAKGNSDPTPPHPAWSKGFNIKLAIHGNQRLNILFNIGLLNSKDSLQLFLNSKDSLFYFVQKFRTESGRSKRKTKQNKTKNSNNKNNSYWVPTAALLRTSYK